MDAHGPDRFEALLDEVHKLGLGLAAMRDQILEKIESSYVRKDTHELHMAALNERIVNLTEQVAGLRVGRNWLVGIVLSSVLVAILSLVVKGGTLAFHGG